MSEFVKKTMMGYREVPGGHSDPECTHVILTDAEYRKLLRQISDAEQIARTAKHNAERDVEEAEREADYKVNQAVSQAKQEIKKWREALEAEQAENNYQRSLNENLLRISRERPKTETEEGTYWVSCCSLRRERAPLWDRKIYAKSAAMGNGHTKSLRCRSPGRVGP